MSVSTEIAALLARKSYIVAYSPLRTEVAWEEFLMLPDEVPVHIVPPRASVDPMHEAETVRIEARDCDATILVPGRRFDATGTRHGQGGGWYDRFLANVPRQWLRVGFCYADQFSEDILPRQSWDQAMDYVVVLDRKTGAATLYSCEGSTHHD